MSAIDGTESGGAGEPPDAKAEEEERYRLKTIALQECYDTVALQSVRLRERIYQVKKQCRRLEVMKRVALNMLHQNTGTFDIPPLEIVDEDPLPSFLESLHKQQHLTAEPPRKKSKRPSRSKTDGKLTPEEEERAKQKICSIIDSVYSETARRMGDTSKRPLRNANVVTPASAADVTRRMSDVVAFNTLRKLNEEGHQTALHNQPDAGKSADGHASSDAASTQFNGHPEVGHSGEDQEESSVTSYSVASSDDSSVVGYDPMLNPKQTMVYDDTGKPSPANYPNMSSEVYDAGLAYNPNAEHLTDTAYDVPLDAIQPMNYSVDGADRNQHRSEHSMNYGVLQDGNAIMYDNSSNYSNLTTSPVPPSCSENINASQVLDYARAGNSAQPVQYVSEVSKEFRDRTHPNTPLNYEEIAASPARQANGTQKITASSEGSGETAPKPTRKTTTPPTIDPIKQDVAKPCNNGLPLPNFIPYRMIAVENPKPVEVVTIDSGDELTSPKQLPKRRRKYKYVVESVLDNVPYTFRQAESDDDETTDKHSTTINTSIRTTN
ncbi:hypothetical protein ANCCAN_11133 [Ancylostoma caninum]|uniref:Uncharacterized protein n=1 Tax=Ancylostoma caninum TaxID=29170 RepID=A0A368GI43_ANCCA|nr:hypothetical protein ANCCAN_11133 [Ancylostoma caninum]